MLGWFREWIRGRRGRAAGEAMEGAVEVPVTEASEAIARAREAVDRAAEREELVSELTKSFRELRQRNRFGEMIAESFRRTSP